MILFFGFWVVFCDNKTASPCGFIVDGDGDTQHQLLQNAAFFFSRSSLYIVIIVLVFHQRGEDCGSALEHMH